MYLCRRVFILISSNILLYASFSPGLWSPFFAHTYTQQSQAAKVKFLSNLWWERICFVAKELQWQKFVKQPIGKWVTMGSQPHERYVVRVLPPLHVHDAHVSRFAEKANKTKCHFSRNSSSLEDAQDYTRNLWRLLSSPTMMMRTKMNHV